MYFFQYLSFCVQKCSFLDIFFGKNGNDPPPTIRHLRVAALEHHSLESERGDVKPDDTVLEENESAKDVL